jgi:REP element-mobilizing transposase RayT
MPRQSRIDAAGALHHITIRGIERRRIFVDDQDREDFIERLSQLLQETKTLCYAWALMSNHVHLLLRTGISPIASIMRRLLTGYAVGFNRRHRRYGHLFQNRYKSILCEEDPYLQQLVAYIHLNPVRAGMVEDIATLKAYPFTGHSALMGKMLRPWQDTEFVLALFGGTLSEARRSLQEYLSKWSTRGRCPELTGGGLIRSAGGWHAVKEAYRDGIRISSDERILGSSDFVETTLKHSGEVYGQRLRMKAAGTDLTALVGAVCGHLQVGEKELESTTRRLEVARARALVSHIATRELSIAGSEVARRFHIDRSAVSRAAHRVLNDPDLTKAARAILAMLQSVASQR